MKNVCNTPKMNFLKIYLIAIFPIQRLKYIVCISDTNQSHFNDKYVYNSVKLMMTFV
jgi:hypothetical protein